MTDRQTNRESDRVTDGETDRQRDKRADVYDVPTYRQTNRPTGRKMKEK